MFHFFDIKNFEKEPEIEICLFSYDVLILRLFRCTRVEN